MAELHNLLDYDYDNDHDKDEHRFAEHGRLLMQYSPTENPEDPLKGGPGFSVGSRVRKSLSIETGNIRPRLFELIQVFSGRLYYLFHLH